MVFNRTYDLNRLILVNDNILKSQPFELSKENFNIAVKLNSGNKTIDDNVERYLKVVYFTQTKELLGGVL